MKNWVCEVLVIFRGVEGGLLCVIGAIEPYAAAAPLALQSDANQIERKKSKFNLKKTR